MRTRSTWLQSFYPDRIQVDHRERLRASVGALLGIAVTGAVSLLLLGQDAPWLIAPMGASAVLLFAVPASPLAQPWSIMGGNLVAALIGVSCAMLVPQPALAAGLAICLAIGSMFWLRCLHPPSGAVALTAVLGGPAIHALGYSFVWSPVLLNSALLLGTALVYNNATRRPYPHANKTMPADHHTRDLPPEIRFGFNADDLNAVLKQYNQVLDISREDLETLFQQTELHALQRRFGQFQCADIMSKDVIAVEFGTELQAAWTLLREHDIKALPVIDRAQRVIGIVTPIDFLRHADLDRLESLPGQFRRFLQRVHLTHSEKPEVVGQIMSTPVVTAEAGMHAIGLMPMMSRHGVHHIPIVNDERRLVGIITQSDLVNALYYRRLHEIDPAIAVAQIQGR